MNFKMKIMWLTALLFIIIVFLSNFGVYADTISHKKTSITCAQKPGTNETIDVFKYVSNSIEA